MKDATIILRVTAEEKQDWEERAKREGLTLSELIRNALTPKFRRLTAASALTLDSIPEEPSEKIDWPF